MGDFETTNEDNARSPSKVSDHVRVLIHCNSSSTIMAIVRANRGKFVVRTVGEILVFNTCVDFSVLPFER